MSAVGSVDGSGGSGLEEERRPRPPKRRRQAAARLEGIPQKHIVFVVGPSTSVASDILLKAVIALAWAYVEAPPCGVSEECVQACDRAARLARAPVTGFLAYEVADFAGIREACELESELPHVVRHAVGL